jgi:hypothetical protein
MSNNPFYNPFCSQPPVREVFTLSTPPKESSVIPYILFFSIIFFILLITVALGSQMSMSDMIYEEHPYVIKVATERAEEYKNFVAPKNGILKLTKGVVTQVHHTIKEDSVIILSRKSIDGKAGSQLIVKDIVPNKKFTIHSINSDDDSTETEDCGEIYFAVI